MTKMFSKLSPIAQIVTINLATSAAIALTYVWAANAQSITPQTRVNCDRVVCTVDGSSLVKKHKRLAPCRLDGKIIKGCWVRWNR